MSFLDKNERLKSLVLNSLLNIKLCVDLLSTGVMLSSAALNRTGRKIRLATQSYRGGESLPLALCAPKPSKSPHHPWL
jgi:hypothetical protein